MRVGGGERRGGEEKGGEAEVGEGIFHCVSSFNFPVIEPCECVTHFII